MPTIHPNTAGVTLVNTFTVSADQQDRLVELLTEATDNVIRHLSGFISVSIHRGVDGTKVANYAQWQSKEHVMAVQAHPDVQAYMRQVAQLIEQSEPVLYEVTSSHEPS